MNRKMDHIELAAQSQLSVKNKDSHFYYEPLFSKDTQEIDLSLSFLQKKMNAPIWISSMTGGIEHAHQINLNLAKVTNEFKLGMGLGSCRSYLFEKKRKEDFALRDIVGDQPFFANLGIAQLEYLLENKEIHKLHEMVKELQCDGIIIHINPIQEFLQIEGDRLKKSPAENLNLFLKVADIPVIVKEVGQGFGPKSLEFLMSLPLAAIDLAGFGGTNFAAVELARHKDMPLSKRKNFDILSQVGHSNDEMINWINQSINMPSTQCQSIIVSGGIDNFLTGYRYLKKLNVKNKVYGMGFEFLKRASSDYAILRDYVSEQIEGLKFAHGYLDVKEVNNE